MGTLPPISPIVLIRSAGEMASGIAWRLHRANIRRLCMVELDDPLCVRRSVAFCPALESPSATVEGVEAIAARSSGDIASAWRAGTIPIVRTNDWAAIDDIRPDVVVDAIIAKRNLGTRIDDAALVIGLGPGFEASVDCHLVIETNRGHHLGRLIEAGRAEPDTGTPGDVAGFTTHRVLRAPVAGTFHSQHVIGQRVALGEIVGRVGDAAVNAGIDGVLRGLIRPGTVVEAGLKLGDIDPRCAPEHCHTVSDKARALGGAVLEALMRHFNRTDAS
ncbi:MAG: EF2563 family selenium-dependent molybdenum hydroxylase system protein [Burkholderiaceae bacterium]|nr:EF2563 family selenium-dependent molybdenum hydroxylase system protein [Burkholderiaceae bacterium]